jgi:MFS family permease
VFWIVQTFEMMERGAYYSMVPIIAYHAIYNVGMPEWLGGMILAFMYPFQYGLPIFSGALAEKVGYRKQMIFAFSFLTLAYFFLFSAFSPITMILAAMTVGIGIGSYKPLVSATVAKCTTSEDRNIAYGIYYWIVNFAAAVWPIVFVGLDAMGIIEPEAYRYVFLFGGIMVSLNIFTAIFIFEEVPRSGKVKTVQDAVNNIKLAFKDYKFVVMVILIGGFWAQYATLLFAIQIIIFGYQWNPWFFTAMFLGIPNPLTIILLGPFISKYIEKVESMRVMLAGLLVYLIGFIILCFSLQIWVGVIIGIVIASIGEFMVAPGYLAFISKLAPKDNVSAYIGCNFISYMIGLLGGTIVFSLIVAKVAVEMQMPYFFYGILVSFGLFLFTLAVLYYNSWGQDVIARAKKIREEEEGKKEEVDKSYVEPLIFRLYESKKIVIFPLLLIPIMLFSTFSLGTFIYIGPEEDIEVIPPTDWTKYNVVVGSFEENGYLNENSEEELIFNITEPNVISVTFTLTWQDEGDVDNRHTNDPDYFSLGVQGPIGPETFTSPSPTGVATLTKNFDPWRSDPYYNGSYEYVVRIIAGEAGDHEPLVFDPLNFRTTPDDGNNWDLSIEYEYYVKAA